MTYQPPKTLLDVIATLDVSDALAADDPRYVPTQQARGSEKTLTRLARKFGLDLESGAFRKLGKAHVLFCGHVGSGKTTELRQYATRLHGAGKLHVIEVDTANFLDRNDLQYAETLMLMARSLFDRLADLGLDIDKALLDRLQGWFIERVHTDDLSRDFSAEIKTGAEASLTLPLFAKLFATLTTAFKTNSTHKESLRRVIRNSFAQFADLFNLMLESAERELAAAGEGNRVLFIVDGTDKMRGEDAKRFFFEDRVLWNAIDALVLYGAHISLKYEGNASIWGNADIVLPMIKPLERDGSTHFAGLVALRNILLHRADRSLFASEAEIERLTAACGGHPRELLRLLSLCCEFADDDRIDDAAVTAAIKSLASDYRRFLDQDDYRLLRRIDEGGAHDGNDERTRKLLLNLALLDYNDGSWQRSHPVVRTLEGYARAGKTAAPGEG